MDGRGRESRRNCTCLGGVVDLVFWGGGRRELEEARELEEDGLSMSVVYRCASGGKQGRQPGAGVVPHVGMVWLESHVGRRAVAACAGSRQVAVGCYHEARDTATAARSRYLARRLRLPLPTL